MASLITLGMKNPIECSWFSLSQCGGKENPGDQLLCDECDMAYHIYCLVPPLKKIPDDDEW